MTWTKLSDDFAEECWSLSDAGFRLLVEMLNYSNRRLMDCLIPKDELRLFAKRPEAVQELIAGTWIADVEDAYEIRFHSLYQPSRSQVIAIRDRNARNGSKGGRPRKADAETQMETQLGSQMETQRDGTGLATPVPQINTPSPSESDDLGAPPQADDGDHFEEFWSAYPRHGSKAKAQDAWKATRADHPSDLLARVKQYARDRQGKEAKYTLNPENWLTKRDWEQIKITGPSAEYLAWLQTPEGKEHTARKEHGA